MKKKPIERNFRLIKSSEVISSLDQEVLDRLLHWIKELLKIVCARARLLYTSKESLLQQDLIKYYKLLLKHLNGLIPHKIEEYFNHHSARVMKLLELLERDNRAYQKPTGEWAPI